MTIHLKCLAAASTLAIKPLSTFSERTMILRVLMSLLMIVQPLAAGEWCRCMARVSSAMVAAGPCVSEAEGRNCADADDCCPIESSVVADPCCSALSDTGPAHDQFDQGCCSPWDDCSSCETCGLLPVDESKIPALPVHTPSMADLVPNPSDLPTGVVMEVAPPTVPNLPNLARALPPPAPPDRAALSVWVI